MPIKKSGATPVQGSQSDPPPELGTPDQTPGISPGTNAQGTSPIGTSPVATNAGVLDPTSSAAVDRYQAAPTSRSGTPSTPAIRSSLEQVRAAEDIGMVLTGYRAGLLLWVTKPRWGGENGVGHLQTLYDRWCVQVGQEIEQGLRATPLALAHENSQENSGELTLRPGMRADNSRSNHVDMAWLIGQWSEHLQPLLEHDQLPTEAGIDNLRRFLHQILTGPAERVGSRNNGGGIVLALAEALYGAHLIPSMRAAFYDDDWRSLWELGGLQGLAGVVADGVVSTLLSTSREFAERIIAFRRVDPSSETIASWVYQPRVVIHDDPVQLGLAAAHRVRAVLEKKPNAVMLFPTGTTMHEFYANIVVLAKSGQIDFSRATIFMLDEYRGGDDFRRYIERHLLSQLPPGNRPKFYHLAGWASDPEVELLGYDYALRQVKKIDLVVLGVGVEGHIAGNEAGSGLSSRARVVEMSPSTREANQLATHWMTVGIASIMAADAVLVLANSAAKRTIVSRFLSEPPGPSLPVSWLRLHPHVDLMVTPQVLDREAADARSLSLVDRRNWEFPDSGVSVRFNGHQVLFRVVKPSHVGTGGLPLLDWIQEVIALHDAVERHLNARTRPSFVPNRGLIRYELPDDFEADALSALRDAWGEYYRLGRIAYSALTQGREAALTVLTPEQAALYLAPIAERVERLHAFSRGVYRLLRASARALGHQTRVDTLSRDDHAANSILTEVKCGSSLALYLVSRGEAVQLWWLLAGRRLGRVLLMHTLHRDATGQPADIQLSIDPKLFDAKLLEEMGEPLSRLLGSLVENSLRYGRELDRSGTTAVQITATLENNGVVIAVSDTGLGMGPEAVMRYGEQGYREGAQASKVKGTGLGTTIVVESAHRLGARAWSVSSRPGQGTTTTLTVPLDHLFGSDEFAVTQDQTIFTASPLSDFSSLVTRDLSATHRYSPHPGLSVIWVPRPGETLSGRPLAEGILITIDYPYGLDASDSASWANWHRGFKQQIQAVREALRAGAVPPPVMIAPSFIREMGILFQQAMKTQHELNHRLYQRLKDLEIRDESDLKGAIGAVIAEMVSFRDYWISVDGVLADIWKTWSGKENPMVGASHDLRNRARTIPMFYELALGRLREGEIDDANELIRGQVGAVLLPDTIGRLMGRVYNTHIPLAMRGQVDLTVDLDSAVSAQSLTNIDAVCALLRVCDNLVINALSHRTPNEPGFVRVRAAIEDDQLVITVEDDGYGMSADEVNRYGSGERGQLAQAIGIEGSGRGAKNVKDLLQMLGVTEFKIDSKQGGESRGTVIQLRVPLEHFMASASGLGKITQHAVTTRKSADDVHAVNPEGAPTTSGASKEALDDDGDSGVPRATAGTPIRASHKGMTYAGLALKIRDEPDPNTSSLRMTIVSHEDRHEVLRAETIAVLEAGRYPVPLELLSRLDEDQFVALIDAAHSRNNDTVMDLLREYGYHRVGASRAGGTALSRSLAARSISQQRMQVLKIIR